MKRFLAAAAEKYGQATLDMAVAAGAFPNPDPLATDTHEALCDRIESWAEAQGLSWQYRDDGARHVVIFRRITNQSRREH